MKRVEDWPGRLQKTVDASRRRDFVWGEFDCCLFVADAVKAMTGTDIAIRYRGKYKSKRGAMALLRKLDGGGVQEAATRAFGAPLTYRLTARRGDVALVDTPDGDALGICTGPWIVVPRPDEGLVALPLGAARMAWRVG